jgi:hypothetical protein
MTTITEALAEIKTISKRVETKREFVQRHIARPRQVVDPLEGEGGSEKAVKESLQSLGDLAERITELRTGIHKANLKTRLTVNGHTRTIQEWLAWRKETAPLVRLVYQGLVRGIEQLRTQFVRDNPTLEKGDIITTYPEKEMADKLEDIETTLGELDGALSLANATTDI